MPPPNLPNLPDASAKRAAVKHMACCLVVLIVGAVLILIAESLSMPAGSGIERKSPDEEIYCEKGSDEETAAICNPLYLAYFLPGLVCILLAATAFVVIQAKKSRGRTASLTQL